MDVVVSCVSVIYGFFALNAVTAFFIAVGIFSYVIIYTVWLKRRNSSNIVIGGIAGSAAAWAGWAAATGSMDLLGILSWFLGLCLDSFSLLVSCNESLKMNMHKPRFQCYLL